jgi:hypothetical protein
MPRSARGGAGGWLVCTGRSRGAPAAALGLGALGCGGKARAGRGRCAGARSWRPLGRSCGACEAVWRHRRGCGHATRHALGRLTARRDCPVPWQRRGRAPRRLLAVLATRERCVRASPAARGCRFGVGAARRLRRLRMTRSAPARGGARRAEDPWPGLRSPGLCALALGGRAPRRAPGSTRACPCVARPAGGTECPEENGTPYAAIFVPPPRPARTRRAARTRVHGGRQAIRTPCRRRAARKSAARVQARRARPRGTGAFSVNRSFPAA